MRWMNNGMIAEDTYVRLGYAFFLVMMFAIPALIIVPLNVVTVVLLYKRRQNRKALGGATSVDSATVTLIAIVLVFVLLRTPFSVLCVFEMDKTKAKGNASMAMDLLVILSRCAVALNPSMNFVVYFVTGTSFRTQLRQRMSCKRKQKCSSSSLANSVTSDTRF